MLCSNQLSYATEKLRRDGEFFSAIWQDRFFVSAFFLAPNCRKYKILCFLYREPRRISAVCEGKIFVSLSFRKQFFFMVVADYIQETIFVVYAVLSIAIFFFLFSRLRKMRAVEMDAEHRAQQLELAKREAEIAARDIQSKAETAAQSRLAEADKIIEERQAAVRKLEQSASDAHARAAELSVKIDERLLSLRRDEDALAAEKKSVAELRSRYESGLLNAAKLSPEAAKDAAIAIATETAREDSRKIRREILEKSEDEYATEARRILIDTMQRIAPRINEEGTSELVGIPSEETKGRLIGREGRNIKCFEQVTGTTLIIDDTPGSVLISSFDPFRRHVAALALRRLIVDGRIHPQSIESFVKSSNEEVLGNAIETGAKTCEYLGLFDVDERILELLGKLRFRLSVNQNTLTHSVETAQLCGIFAAELGLNVTTATRAGLFHDIGKALDAESETAHALAGARILRQAGESEEVINAVESHHREVGHTSIYAPLLMLADSISATRPGARSNTHDGYAERIRNLEAIARRFDGVVDAFAIRAGHEVRVIVSSDEVDDAETRVLAQKIRMAIEDELMYPGKIRVVVVREFRVTEEAL